MARLNDDVALVTGAARGIGAAIARRFVQEGARVLLTDVLDEEGTRLAGALGPAATYRHLDVTSPAQWEAAVAEAEGRGPLTVLVNNAGILAMGTIEEQPPEEFRRVIDVNLYGAWLGIRAAAPALRRAGRGVILDVSSTAGLMGYANLGPYVASKWALRGLTKVAALELAPEVRVCSIHPGPITTPMTAGMDDSIVVSQPLPRFGTADEVAAMAVFLVAEATYSTGSEFVVDGGAVTGSMVLADAGHREP